MKRSSQDPNAYNRAQVLDFNLALWKTKMRISSKIYDSSAESRRFPTSGVDFETRAKRVFREARVGNFLLYILIGLNTSLDRTFK